MFVQIIEMTSPLGTISQLRKLIAEEYLPSLRDRDGFVSAQFLEQVDDRDKARLIIYWENHNKVEDAHRTGVLAGSNASIAARIPGLRIQRQSYIVSVALVPQAEATAV